MPVFDSGCGGTTSPGPAQAVSGDEDVCGHVVLAAHLAHVGVAAAQEVHVLHSVHGGDGGAASVEIKGRKKFFRVRR